MFTDGFFEPSPLVMARRGDGRAWALLGPEHLSWLAACMLACIVLTRVYRRLPAGVSPRSARHRMQVGVSAVPLLLLASLDAAMIATSSFTPPFWPLHSCNLCELLCLVYALLPGGRTARLRAFIGEVLFTLGLSGAAFALLFPGWYYCDAWSWPSLCGFVEHALIVSFVVMLLAGGDLRPRRRDLPRGVAFALTCAALARALNARLGTNFFFVSVPMEGSPLTLFARLLGDPGYLVPYVACLIALWWGMHHWWELLQGRTERAGHLSR